MAIDPSIPLQFRGLDLGQIMREAEQLKSMQADREYRQFVMDDKRQERADELAKREAYRQVFAGGMNGAAPNDEALSGLAAVDPEEAFKVKKYFAEMDEDSRKRAAEKWKAAGPALADLATVPFEQRAAYMQRAFPALQAAGWTTEELMNVDLSDASIRSLATTQKTVEQVLDSQRLRWHPVGEGGIFATDSMGNPTGEGNPYAPTSPRQTSGADEATLRQQAADAIARGADPAQVNARLEQMLGGASQSGSPTFPQP